MIRRLTVPFALVSAVALLAALVILLLREPPRPELPTVQPPPGPGTEEAQEPDVPRARKERGTLYGKVVHGLTEEPVPRATVRALAPKLEPVEDGIPTWGGQREMKRVHTDEQGRFEIEDLPPDYWNLWVEKRGFAWTNVPRVRFQEEHVIRLFPAGSVRGRVVHPDGEPAPGIRVEYTPQHTLSEVFGRYEIDGEPFRERYQKVTDRDGRFVFRDLPPGLFTVEVFPENHLPAPWAHQPPLEPGEDRDLGVRKLDEGHGMEVHVRWAGTEEPVEGIEVKVEPVADPLPRTKTGQTRRTNSRGIARFQGLGGQVLGDRVQFQVTAIVPGEGPVPPDERRHFRPGEKVVIHLRRKGVVKGEVENPRGEPLWRFKVTLEATDHVERQIWAWGDDGEFTLHGVPEGVYSVHIDYRTLVNTRIDGVQVEAGEETDIGTVTLLEGGAVEGVVRLSNGRVPDFTVKVVAARRKTSPSGAAEYEPVAYQFCRTDGSYRITGLPEGELWLEPQPFLTAESLKTGRQDHHWTMSRAVTEVTRIVVPRGGQVVQDLTLWGQGYLDLHFFDLIEGAEQRVVRPRTELLELRTGERIVWRAKTAPALKPGRYVIFVTMKDDEGVERTWRVREVTIKEGETLGPIQLRLHEIRQHEPQEEEER